MKDCNGCEIKAGDVVKIDGAYFKHQNGYFFVERDGSGSINRKGHILLHRISKFGQISNKSDCILDYPFDFDQMCAKKWNNKNAKIEIVHSIDMREVIIYFKREYELADFDAKWARVYGKPDGVIEELKKEADWFKSINERLKAN